MERTAEDLLGRLTLEEKARLVTGRDAWTTAAVERLEIPGIVLADGPHGVRRPSNPGDLMDLSESIPATCFPAGAGLASSWNPDLLSRVGAALGEEAQAIGVAILLGPAVNIKRSPLGGRNFEYYSEDPFLAGTLAAAYIQGLQSRGVGASLKHYAVNNQETRRMTVDAIVDERTLREIYLAGFETAVKEAQPWTVMAAYNRVNGCYAAENETLLRTILQDEWGHDGFVVSDWGAVNEIAASVRAGLSLEMPSSGSVGPERIVAAVRSGELDERTLDQAVVRLLRVVLKAVAQRRPDAAFDAGAHDRLAREAARETMVLLKNEDAVLPLSNKGRIALIGELAERPRYQGGGSSHVRPTRVTTVREAMAAVDRAVEYVPGYRLDDPEPSPDLVEAAVAAARAAEVAVLCLGLPERAESEGYDRSHLDLPPNQVALVDAVAAAQPNLVVVLMNGAPVVMPWIGRVKGILEAYLGGQAAGGAIVDLLFGDANPSGKLAESFPEQLAQNPSHPYFPGERDRVEYREGVLVGYRYYDTKEIAPLFPFGFGLSYTTFAYSDLRLDRTRLRDGEPLTVSVAVRNTGDRYGAEVVQCYVRDPVASVVRPVRELKGFGKIGLHPGELKTVTFTLDRRSFAYYDTALHDFRVEPGRFVIEVGASSRDIRLRQEIEIEAGSPAPGPISFDRNSTLGEILKDPRGQAFFSEWRRRAGFPGPAEAFEDPMMQAMMKDLPLRALLSLSGGRFTAEQLAALLRALNDRDPSERPSTR